MINWGFLEAAMRFYGTLGYHQIDVPWRVPLDVIHMTFPEEHKDREGNLVLHDGRALVGSSEQSFLFLEKTHSLIHSRYVTTSPCFRFETSYNEIRKEEFMKTELFVRNASIADVEGVLNDAIGFFTPILDREESELKVVDTHEGYDLELMGIEIGSYGYRQCGDTKWVYGTGIAEPRFSTVLMKCLNREK